MTPEEILNQEKIEGTTTKGPLETESEEEEEPMWDEVEPE